MIPMQSQIASQWARPKVQNPLGGPPGGTLPRVPSPILGPPGGGAALRQPQMQGMQAPARQPAMMSAGGMGTVAPPALSTPSAPAEGTVLGGNIPGPAFGPSPTTGLYDLPKHGLKQSPKNIQKQLAQQQYALFQSLLPSLYGSLNSLADKANTDHFSPEERAAFLTPRLQSLEGGMQLAESGLNRNLADRGLDSSSEAVNQWANLGQRGATARAGITNDLFNNETERQRTDQARLMDAIMSIMGRSSDSAGTQANTIRAQKMMQDAQNKQGQFDIQSLLGGAGGLMSLLFPGGGLGAGALGVGGLGSGASGALKGLF